MTTSIERLAAAQFVLLTTFRRDGRAVPTAVWVAPVPDGLGIWTAVSTGKVKRIRHDGRVTLAECDRRGTPLGPPVRGQARVLEEAGTARVRAAIRAKYGFVAKMFTTLSGLRPGPSRNVGLAVTLE